MLDIPELDGLICGQLRRRDLVQCAQVCKKWHALVIPHLWRDLSWINQELILGTVTDAFSRIVQEDYQAEQEDRELHDVKQSIPAQSSRPLSALSKYGHCIRLLPNPYNLSQPQEHLLHLLKRCSPDVQVKSFGVDADNLDIAPDEPETAILNFTLPRVRNLSVYVGPRALPSGVSKLMDLLDQPSIVLERLNLEAVISNVGMTDVKGVSMENERKTCTTLRQLVFSLCDYNTGAEGFWSSLLGRCGRVRKVQVILCTGAAQRLAQGMWAYMPNLYEICLGEGVDVPSKPDDAAMATLLSGSRNGWKIVRLRSKLGTAIMDALSKHSCTLKLLDIQQCNGTLSQRLGQVLGSCTNLHILASTESDSEDSRFCAEIDYKAFINLDSDTGAPKPWKCEASLKELKVIITGIPRPDLEEGDSIKEAYPGEGREIQGRVYDRLARFTNLETLWLGDNANFEFIKSLEMSLESGLGKLGGLKKLREISVLGLATSISLVEVQWMTANWPRLRVVSGLQDDEASAWLEEYTDVKCS